MYRIEYLRERIEQMRLAIDDGVDLIGYIPWTASLLHIAFTVQAEVFLYASRGAARRYGLYPFPLYSKHSMVTA